METKLIKAKTAPSGLAVNRLGNTAIAPRAVLAWGRIPSQDKAEILAVVERPSAAGDGNTKTVRVGEQMLTVRNMSSGFRVVYESGADRNTIISVLTPREAGLARG